MTLVPNLAFEGAFFFLGGIGFSIESASNNHFTSSAVKCLPCGIVSRRKISSVCASDKTCRRFSSSIKSLS